MTENVCGSSSVEHRFQVTSEPLISLDHVSASIRLPRGGRLITVDDVTAAFQRGTSTAIVGASGSGKTSLASIIGLLNADFTGELRFAGEDMSRCPDARRAKLRNGHIGFVFQNYSLIDHLNVWENVALPLQYRGHVRRSAQRRIAMRGLAEVGLRDRARDRPSRLSGGEQQRVAIARALVANPDLVICDEPTGALDTVTGRMVSDMLFRQIHDHGATLILVTHDPRLAARCERVLHMSQGGLRCST